MYDPQNNPPSIWERNKLLIKGFMTGFLIVIMLIPASIILNLVRERQSRQEEVVSEVSNKWAKGQTVTGPMLMIPYIESTIEQGKVSKVRRTAYVLPETYMVNGNVQPERRHRSLFDVILYRANVEMKGHFGKLPLDKLQLDPANIIWPEVKLVMGIDDARGLEEDVQLDWNGNKQILESGTMNTDIATEELGTQVAMDTTKGADFAIKLKVKGSQFLHFTPVGKTTEVSLQAPWKDPDFEGQYLPDTSNITDKDFSAHWKILAIARNFPQYWKDKGPDLKASSFGVKLIQPVDGYSKTERSVKYAILFIALTFTIFFFIEILQKRQVHPLQYILVGMALCLFYTLLLSLSEYLGFNVAYFISTLATVILIGLYVWSIFKSGKTAIGFSVALSGLYIFIFILIQLQDYALLFGSIGLFVVLAVMMYYSRKIDWYGVTTKKQEVNYESKENEHEEQGQ